MTHDTVPAPVRLMEGIAVAVARGDRTLAREALQWVRVQYWKGLYSAARGSFMAWSRAVMARYCYNVWADRRRLPGGHDAIVSAIDRFDGLGATAYALDLTDPFCCSDLAAVRAWSASQRIVLLTWFGLWGKLPEADRRTTLAAVGGPGDFPPSGFETWSAADRITRLTAVLGTSRNVVAQIRCRDVAKLASWKFIRQLREP